MFNYAARYGSKEVEKSRLNLTDINNGVKPVITVSLEWVNDDNVNDLDKDIGADSSYLLVDFNATQYKG